MRRTLLSRVVVPRRLLAEWEVVESRHGWWVEARGRRLYLRARLNVRKWHCEEAPIGHDTHTLVLLLNSEGTERITWTDGQSQQAGNASNLLAPSVRRYPALIAIPSEIDLGIEELRGSIATPVPSLEVASKRLRGLF